TTRRADQAVDQRRRWRDECARARWEARRPGRSCARPPFAAWAGSSRRSGAAAGTACLRPRGASPPPGPWPAPAWAAPRRLEAMAGPDTRDPSTLSAPAPMRYASLLEESASDGFGVDGLTVGVPDRYFTDGVDADAEAAYRDALRLLEAKGCNVRDVRLPLEF